MMHSIPLQRSDLAPNGPKILLAPTAVRPSMSDHLAIPDPKKPDVVEGEYLGVEPNAATGQVVEMITCYDDAWIDQTLSRKAKLVKFAARYQTLRKLSESEQ